MNNVIWTEHGSFELVNNNDTAWTEIGAIYLGDASGTITEHVYYDMARDALVVAELRENQAATEIGPQGVLSLAGEYVQNSGLSKEFRLLANGNLEARDLLVE